MDLCKHSPKTLSYLSSPCSPITIEGHASWPLYLFGLSETGTVIPKSEAWGCMHLQGPLPMGNTSCAMWLRSLFSDMLAFSTWQLGAFMLVSPIRVLFGVHGWSPPWISAVGPGKNPASILNQLSLKFGGQHASPKYLGLIIAFHKLILLVTSFMNSTICILAYLLLQCSSLVIVSISARRLSHVQLW